MTKNPFLNALSAIAYIVLVVSVLYNGNTLFGPEDNILMPIAALSLLVFSAATMAFIFFFRPLQMYLDGEKREAVSLFLKTLFSFGAIILVVFAALIIVGR